MFDSSINCFIYVTIHKGGSVVFMKILDYDRIRLLSILPPNGVCAEIGVWQGEYSEQIIKNSNPKELYLIDKWDVQELKTEAYAEYYRNFTKTEEFVNVYNSVIDKFSTYEEVKLIRNDSVLASYDFDDQFFDWVYIDADHSYQGVTNDLNAYYGKVKDGGYICGHDWNNPEDEGVNYAVLDFVESKNVQFVGVTNEANWSSYVLKKNDN